MDKLIDSKDQNDCNGMLAEKPLPIVISIIDNLEDKINHIKKKIYSIEDIVSYTESKIYQISGLRSEELSPKNEIIPGKEDNISSFEKLHNIITNMSSILDNLDNIYSRQSKINNNLDKINNNLDKIN